MELTKAQADFISKVKAGAIEGRKAYGVMPSITIAQSILESGWGGSELATKANNLFGIKASDDWKGPTYTVKTAEYDKNNKKYYIDAAFRKYDTITASINDHSRFFTSTAWRKENYKEFLKASNYKDAAIKLEAAGYATSKEYAEQLIDLIERYNLNQYDSIQIREVAGMRIFLSVGHSVLKSGATTSASGEVNEYYYNKALAPYVKQELEALGHTVDVVVCPERQFTSWTQERSYKLNIEHSKKYDLVCELHLNASDGKGHGMECEYYPNDSKGRAIAARLCDEYRKLGFTDRGAKERGDLYIINSTRATAVLIESFFCDNKADYALAKKLGYEQIAKAVAAGLTGTQPATSNTSVKQPAAFKGYSVMTNTPNDVLNVRENPDPRSKKVSSYRHGSKIYVHGVVHNHTGTWYKIEYKKGVFGYVAAAYCKGI